MSTANSYWNLQESSECFSSSPPPSSAKGYPILAGDFPLTDPPLAGSKNILCDPFEILALAFPTQLYNSGEKRGISQDISVTLNVKARILFFFFF